MHLHCVDLIGSSIRTKGRDQPNHPTLYGNDAPGERQSVREFEMLLLYLRVPAGHSASERGRKSLKMVARGGIEPPTRGFSVPGRSIYDDSHGFAAVHNILIATTFPLFSDA